MILHNDVFYKGILGIYTSATRLVCTFQVPLPPVDDRKKMVEEVGKDRRYAIDACLVRIMKAKKVLTHQQLILECVEQLSKMFKVTTIFQPLWISIHSRLSSVLVLLVV